MNKLALKLPGGEEILPPPTLNPNITDLGSLISGIINIIAYIALFLTFYFLIWGAWSYIFAGGEKEALGKARERIKWALIGLIIVLLSYSIARYAGEIFPPAGGDLPF